MSIKFYKNQAGFTLIEMMVAVSIFAIVALITSGSFIILSDLYRKVQTNRAVVDNLNLAMDTMSLQIREGQDYDFTGCTLPTGNGDCIEFKELVVKNGQIIHNRDIEYHLNDSTLEQCLTEYGGDDLEEVCQALTSTEIEVDQLRFISDPFSRVPRVTVVLSGIAKSKVGLSSDFLLQTSISQRNYPR